MKKVYLALALTGCGLVSSAVYATNKSVILSFSGNLVPTACQVTKVNNSVIFDDLFYSSDKNDGDEFGTKEIDLGLLDCDQHVTMSFLETEKIPATTSEGNNDAGISIKLKNENPEIINKELKNVKAKEIKLKATAYKTGTIIPGKFAANTTLTITQN